MSIETTYFVKRSHAIAMVMQKLLACDDDQLADLLDSVRESRFENYQIIPDNYDCTDGEFTKTNW